MHFPVLNNTRQMQTNLVCYPVIGPCFLTMVVGLVWGGKKNPRSKLYMLASGKNKHTEHVYILGVIHALSVSNTIGMR